MGGLIREVVCECVSVSVCNGSILNGYILPVVSSHYVLVKV